MSIGSYDTSIGHLFSSIPLIIELNSSLMVNLFDMDSEIDADFHQLDFLVALRRVDSLGIQISKSNFSNFSIESGSFLYIGKNGEFGYFIDDPLSTDEIMIYDYHAFYPDQINFTDLDKIGPFGTFCIMEESFLNKYLNSFLDKGGPLEISDKELLCMDELNFNSGDIFSD